MTIVVYLAVGLRLIAMKPLWHDEIFTVYLCRLPDIGAVWRALATGLEQIPPLWHVISRASYQALGEGSLAIRLPSLLGFATMAACLFAFLSRRLPGCYALAGMLVPFFSGAAHFGYEGRPYGVVLGCAGLAMVAWQRAEGRRRTASLIVLWVACSAAVSSHYYAVLILIPLALGELVRTYERRRIDYAVWSVLVGALLPLLFFLPLIRGARAYSHSFWAKPGVAAIADSYGRLIVIALPVLIALVLLWLGYLILRGGKAGLIGVPGIAPDLAVAAGFLVSPLAMVALSFVTKAFEPRYGIWGIIGIALCVAYAGHLATGGSRGFGITMTACLLAVFAFSQAIETRRIGERRVESLDTLRPLLARGLPIAYADPLAYLQSAYYGLSAMNARVVYVSDPAAALRNVGTDSPERALMLLAHFTPLNVVPLEEFLGKREPFLVIESGEFSWLVPELVARGSYVRITAASADVRTYEVSPGTGETRPKR